MSNDLLAVLVLSLVALANPTLLAAVTVMMLIPNPKRLMVGYLLGAYVVSIATGLLVVFLLHGSSAERASRHKISPVEDIIVGVLCGLVAVLLGTGRDRSWRERRQRKKAVKQRAKEDAGKPTEALPLRLLGKGDPKLTFIVGAALNLPGVSYIAALDHIHRHDPGAVATVALVVFFCVMQQGFLEVPLIGYAFAPERTQDAVGRFRAWMGRSGRTAAVIGASVICAWLLIRGISHLRPT